MKKYIYIAAMLLAAASCAKENTVSSDLTSGEYKITVNAGADATKTAISHTDGKYSFTWQAGDAISLVEYVAETQAYQKVVSDGVETPGNTASFTATLGALSKESGQNYHYLAAYPDTAVFTLLGWQGEGSESYPIMAFGIPSTQTLPSCSSFDPAADILVSQPIALSERPSSINACFARIGSMLKVHFTGLPTDGDEIYINGGEFSIADNSGSYYLASNFLYYTGEQSVMGYSDYIDSELIPDSKISIVGGPQCPVNKTDGSADVWLRCCPGTVSYGVLDVFLEVMVDGVSHQCTKNAYITSGGSGSGDGGTTGGSTTGGGDGGTTGGGSGLTFKNGEITAITVAVEDQTPEEPDITVSVTKTEVSGNSCILTVKTESKSGAAPTLSSTAACTTVSTYTDPSTLYWNGQAYSDPVTANPGEFVLELKDLNYSTTYYYTVMAYDTSTYDEYYCTMAIFTTGSAPKYVSAPSPVSFDVKDGSFEAFWSPVDGAKEYHCVYFDVKSGEEAAVPVTATYISGDNMWKAAASGLADGNYTFLVSVEPDTDSGWEINPSDPSTAKSYWPFTIGGGGKEDAVTLSVAYLGDGQYIASGHVADQSLWGNDNYAYIYWGAGTLSDPSALTMHAGGKIDSDGSFSCTADGLTEGNIYSFCAAIDPDGTGKNMQYSEIFYLEAKKE